MKRFLLVSLFCVALPAWADDRFSRDRDYGQNYGNNARGGAYGRSPVDRTLRDLQAIWSRSRVDRHESNHFREAIEDLRDFAERASRGRFDRGRLSSAIGNLDHLAQAHQIHPRDRAALRDHLFALQQLRDGRQDAGWRRR